MCDLLTDAQAIELSLPSPGDPGTYGVEDALLACRRDDGLTSDKDVVYSLWLDSDLLGETYAGREHHDDFSSREIEGQPAVVIGADPALSCRVDIGLGERQGIELMAHDRNRKSCELAVAVAERMVRNLAGEG